MKRAGALILIGLLTGACASPTPSPVPTVAPASPQIVHVPAEVPVLTIPPWASPSGVVPTEIDGQPVLSTDDLEREIGYGNASSLLVAGRLMHIPAVCAAPLGETPPPALVHCWANYVLFSVNDDGASVPLSTADLARFDPQGQLAQGELVVLRVHAYDPRASACPESDRRTCELAVVIDGVVWSAV